MIGIANIAVYRPEERTDNFLQGRRHEVTPEFLRDKVGMTGLARKADGQETSDLAEAAVRLLFDRHGLDPASVECLILVTQNPDGAGLPHTAAILHYKLGLAPRCAAFDISLGCSGFVQGLAVTRALMESQGMENGLLVTADPYSKIVDPADRDTSMIFGDGATATWLNSDPVWKFGQVDGGIDSGEYHALSVGADGRLTMKGRAVFNFAARQVPQSISRVLSEAGLTIDDVDLVLLHQGSKFIVDTIAQRIGAEGKTPFASAEYGNTVSSSIPMMLAENVPDTAKRVLISGFGVGLAWATCLLERV